MRSNYTYTYDFFDGARVVSLSAGVCHGVFIVSAVYGSRIYTQDFIDPDCRIENGTVRIGENVFSAAGVKCRMLLDGLRVTADIEFVYRLPFVRPLGWCGSLGLSKSNLEFPSVTGLAEGSITIGGEKPVRLPCPAAVALTTGKEPFSRLVRVVSSGDDYGFCACAGTDKLLWISYPFAAAFCTHGKGSYRLGGGGSLKRFCEDGVSAFMEFCRGRLLLTVQVALAGEAEDRFGTRYSVQSRADIKLVDRFRDEVLFERKDAPTSFAVLGYERIKDAECMKAAEQSDTEAEPVGAKKAPTYKTPTRK